jgi:hypothetical protein
MPTSPGNLGLNPAQFGYAQTIIEQGQKAGASPEEINIALMTALTESELWNQANSNVPESLAIPNDKVGSDHKSVGLFQQQVGIWGTAAELMNPATSADKFFSALKNAPAGDPWVRAQQVQKSEYPDRYKDNWVKAQGIQKVIGAGTRVDSVTKGLGDFESTLSKAGALLSDPEFWRRAGMFALGAALLILVLVKITGTGETIVKAGKLAAKAAVL